MPRKKGKGGTAKRKFTPEKKLKVKRKAKKKCVGKTVPAIQTARRTRLRRQTSTDAFGGLRVLEGPTYVPFARPTGAKTAGARGCKSARVVLGPLVGWPEPLPGTDSQVKYPGAITDVRRVIDDDEYHWKSGHVINADFGGYGGSDENMTCLTSSANTSQTAFDNSVKKARSFLHKVYTALRKSGKQGDFFTGLGYGIEIYIEMSDDAWGDDYPYNCVSNEMRLRATVVKAPAEDDVRAAMAGAEEMAIQQVIADIEKVQELVDKANQRHTVYNVQ